VGTIPGTAAGNPARMSVREGSEPQGRPPHRHPDLHAVAVRAEPDGHPSRQGRPV